MNNLDIERQFDSVKHRAYLAHCAIAPMADSVAEAMSAAMAHFQHHGVHNYGAISGQLDSLKTNLAKLFGGTSSEYALVPNTSFGINQVAQGLHWNPSDTIVLFEGEFPTNVRPWLHAAKCYDLKIATLPLNNDPLGPAVNLETLEQLLTKGVRLVAISAVQFQTGRRMPLQAISELCQRHKTLLFVDAIQACGALPFCGNMCDFWVSGGHKWMLGPEGRFHVRARYDSTAADAQIPRLAKRNSPLNFLLKDGVLITKDHLSEMPAHSSSAHTIALTARAY